METYLLHIYLYPPRSLPDAAAHLIELCVSYRLRWIFGGKILSIHLCVCVCILERTRNNNKNTNNDSDFSVQNTCNTHTHTHTYLEKNPL